MEKSVLVGLSGGVDSSVAALLLKQEGFTVNGATINFCNNDALFEENTDRVRKVTTLLNIPFITLDYRDKFRELIMKDFVEEYENGITPNPCIRCNKYLKWNALYENRSNSYYVATGHYGAVEYDEGSGRFLLRKARDTKKDQSYFLYNMTQELLAHTVLPLGTLTKDEVREIAREHSFINAKEKDSQDICFINDGDYVRFITGFTKKNYPQGDYVNKSGEYLGRHKGIIHYTIGQRKGLGIALKKPQYVLEKDITTNNVILGDNEDLFTREVNIRDVNYIATDCVRSPMKVRAKVRYSQKESSATLYPVSENEAKLIFDEPQRAVAAGQSAVMYKDEYVVGGGIII